MEGTLLAAEIQKADMTTIREALGKKSLLAQKRTVPEPVHRGGQCTGVASAQGWLQQELLGAGLGQSSVVTRN